MTATWPRTFPLFPHHGDSRRKLLIPALLAGLATRAASAANLDVNVEIPRLDVSEYHRPYVAIWIEHAETNEAHG